MAWLCIRLSLPAARIEALSEVLLEVGAQSVTVCDAGDNPVLEPGPGETPLWPFAEVDGLFPLDIDIGAVRTRLIAELGVEVVQSALEVRFIADADWSQTWRNHAVSYCFGGRLWVVPRDAATTEHGAVILRLDPGLAFGTGGHATTGLCLDWLARQQLDGATVVDYGAGSGILGIAALLLGAARAIAVDHDPQACLATRDNANFNAIAADRLSVIAPDALASSPHDLVLANILAEPLVMLAPVLARLVRRGGRLVLSGMLAHQVDKVLVHYPEFAFAPVRLRDSWAMVEGTRTGG